MNMNDYQNTLCSNACSELLISTDHTELFNDSTSNVHGTIEHQVRFTQDLITVSSVTFSNQAQAELRSFWESFLHDIKPESAEISDNTFFQDLLQFLHCNRHRLRQIFDGYATVTNGGLKEINIMFYQLVLNK